MTNPGASPFGSAARELFRLEPGIRFLNHGSFGATPVRVLAAQDSWRVRMERQPVRFMTRELPEALDAAAARLARFVGTSPDRLAFVDNATTAMGAVLRSRTWSAGDEVVLSRHAYPAVRNGLAFLAERFGVIVREAPIPFPGVTPDAVTEAHEQALTSRTRLVIADHVSSHLGIVSPVGDIVASCRARGIPVLVDGAHGPGMLPLELDRLDADWYAGNCHKWLLAPKGSGFLWAAPRAQAGLRPLAVSLWPERGFPGEFGWTGTRDPTGWLAVPEAIAFLEDIGVDRYRGHLRDQAGRAARRLADAWGVGLPAPDEMLAGMVTLPVPGDPPGTQAAADRLHDLLWERHRIEVPVFAVDARLCLRISAQIYLEDEDFDALAEAMPSVLKEAS